MKALIPAAGQGTRLYPHTHTKPKAMVRLAGKPILGHILSSLAETPIEEVVIVVGGSMQDQITEYATELFGDAFEFTFVEQERAEGLGHSIYQAESAVRGEPVLIALGDMLFENGYKQFLDAHDDCRPTDGSIGVKRVENPEHYGVVGTNDRGTIEQLVEKPSEPISDLAISGIYIVEATGMLFDALQMLVEEDIRGADAEYQLTDAFQRMVEQDCDLTTFTVENWYDCGRPETLLDANRVLLNRLETNQSNGLEESVVVPPVDFGAGVEIVNSVVGPNVSIDDGVQVENSLVRDSIVGRNAELLGVNLEVSIVGDNTTVRGKPDHLDIGANSSIQL
ncbi:dtdp-glucose pyrophosphorylase [Haloterrigena salina JCM 13891]|uniref:Dtdp-glucose pyrophosphorylase n=1 Tax=Haloterrigena salina JCM 13891 TaxID=1227488 RepID=M0C959_9EURY|nr:sugar phosphate nucleotidyltransferase [Haloterrigena salina]ELZ19153.1 dtdp-glucose pyrophosphorylase [Haloterrigena salina JCM 13891]